MSLLLDASLQNGFIVHAHAFYWQGLMATLHIDLPDHLLPEEKFVQLAGQQALTVVLIALPQDQLPSDEDPLELGQAHSEA